MKRRPTAKTLKNTIAKIKDIAEVFKSSLVVVPKSVGVLRFSYFLPWLWLEDNEEVLFCKGLEDAGLKDYELMQSPLYPVQVVIAVERD